MGITNLKYANINAKLRGMSAKRLSKDDIYNLIKQTDLKSAVYVLKSQIPNLKNLDEDASRINIERELEKITQNDIMKIQKLLNEKEKEYFKLFIQKYSIKSKRQEETEEYQKYFEELYEKSKEFGKELQEIIGERIDLKNLVYIYRLKKYYKTSSEDINKLLINIHYRLKKETIEKLINANNFEEIIEILQSTKYRQIVENLQEDQLENAINKYLYSEYKQIFIKTKYNMCTIIAYMYLEDYQETNIINILGGINYNLPKDEIQNKIII